LAISFDSFATDKVSVCDAAMTMLHMQSSQECCAIGFGSLWQGTHQHNDYSMHDLFL